MLYDGDELNLEDIEAQLYSQVFHSNNQETTTESNNFELIDNMRPPNPYFQPGRTSKFINNVNNNSSSNNSKKQKSQIQKKPTNFMKPTTQRQQRDLTTTLNQVVVVHPFNNSNNIVCLKEVKKQTRKANRRARFKEKKRAARLKLKLQKVLQNTPKPIKKSPLILGDLEIITLSDSENEDQGKSVENVQDDVKSIVPQNIENEINNDNTTNDDVIFIEPPPIEVINLTEESPEKKQSSDTETASTTSSSSSSSSLKKNQKYQPHERKELLNTPESTSNDFMENTNIDLQQGKFNFSLHGSDFANNNESNKQTTINNNNNNNVNNGNNKHLEICETESTCSTIDVNTLKTTVFTEIDFPKDDLFSEANLENFGNLITPLRSNANKTMITTSTPIQKINNKQICNETDSSSESDLEDTNMNNLQIDKIKKQMNLPNLSPIANRNINGDDDDDDDDDNCNKTNRRKKIGSKFDLIDNERKSKKRKSSESNINDKKKLNKTKKRKSDFNKDDNVKENPDKSIDNNMENNKIVDNEQNSDTLILETSLNESLEHDSENTIKENTENIPVVDQEENVLKGFVIVDEVNNTDINDNKPISVTESESELSEINEYQDITLINCSNPINQTVIEKSTVKDKQDISLKNSSVQEVQQTMSDDPKLWQISERDRSYIRKSTHGRRCTKCRESGHLSIRCPNKKSAPRCRLCGEAGHLVYRCPNSMCVQCGTPGNSSTYCTYCYKFREVFCHICGMIGHIKNRCPDLWRRYHLTTENGPLVTRQGPSLKPKEQLWCSSCAQPGHLEHVCNFTYTPYAKYDPQIYYYHDVYENYNNIEQLYSQSNPNDYQNNQIVPQRYPRYFDNNEYNYHRADNRNNEIIERNTNVESYYYDNDRRGFLNTELNNQEYEETVKRMNQYHIFNKKSFGHIVHLLRLELRYLRSIYRDMDNIVRNLKKSYSEHAHLKISSFYKLLNMILFGIYCFNNGKIHLQRLENLNPISRKNSLTVRRNLYKSYSFIFGSDRHNNVDYRGLLARI